MITQGRHAVDGSGGEQEVPSFLDIRPGRRTHVVDTILVIRVGTSRLAQPVDGSSRVGIQLVDDVSYARLRGARRFIETAGQATRSDSKEIGSARCTETRVGKSRKDHSIADRVCVGVLGLANIDGSVGIDVPSPGNDSRVGNPGNGKSGIADINAEELPRVGIGDRIVYIVNTESHSRSGWRYGHVTRDKSVGEDIL